MLGHLRMLPRVPHHLETQWARAMADGFDAVVAAHRLVKAAASIPVIASSGAGTPEHFSEVFEATGVEAALAASIFHRHVVAIEAIKDHLTQRGIAARRTGVE